jgi:hypothetical protein
MLANLFPARSRNGLATAAVYAMLFLGVSLTNSTVEAQSDPAALAPWQAPPNQRVLSSGESVYSPSRYAGSSQLASASIGASPQRGVVLSDTAQETVEPTENLPYNNGAVGGCAECGSLGGECNSGCGLPDDTACGCDFCLPYAPLWVRGEYLVWWGKSASLPPLVTTGTIANPTANVLLGGDVAPNAHSGGRFSLGWWCSPCRDEGLEVTYMFLGNEAVNFYRESPTTPLLARPFYDTENATPSRILVAVPDGQTGWINASLANELNSVEAIYRRALIRQCSHEVDLLMGYRYGQFDENFRMDTSSTIGTATLQVTDQCRTTNEFHGAEVGFATRTRCDRWSLELLAKFALGGTQSRVNISGATVPASVPSQGVLALASNSGSYSENNFSVIPELGVTFGYDLTCRLKATLGYTFLYWSQVARPGDQIDTNLNLSQVPGGVVTQGVPSPLFNFRTTDFWAQGISAGLDYRF